ncbi:MAG: hypothetical protein K0U41_06625 [Gammaproteobacteria bacterium]|nr:hypothetical protein [Gammaproteobacteria bacterium]
MTDHATEPFKSVEEFTLEEDQKRFDLQQRAVTLEGVTVKFDGVSIYFRLPVSSEGLEAGELWNDNGVLKVAE